MSFHWSSKNFGSDCDTSEVVQTFVHGEFGVTLRACTNEKAVRNREKIQRVIDMCAILFFSFSFLMVRDPGKPKRTKENDRFRIINEGRHTAGV